jgi:hypothetical protein
MVLAYATRILAPYFFINLFFSHSLFAQTNGGMDHRSAAGNPPPFDWHISFDYFSADINSAITDVQIMSVVLTTSLHPILSGKDKLHVYPNPLTSGDMLMIEYGSEITASVMQIIDASGKIVSTKYNVPCKGGISGMLTVGLVPGTYHILVDEKYYARFVITN